MVSECGGGVGERLIWIELWRELCVVRADEGGRMNIRSSESKYFFMR